MTWTLSYTPHTTVHNMSKHITPYFVLLSLLFVACDRTTPTLTPTAPNHISAARAPESQPTKKSAHLKLSTEMPRGHDANPAKIQTLLQSLEPPTPKVTLTEDQWKEKLTDKEFYILRKSGTERAFTGDLLGNKKEGIYTCAGCGSPLFSSHSKFKSGTGWPSFYQPIEAGRVEEEQDNTLGMSRVEVHCAKCGGHLGHVFTDGPDPTGLRYCINSESLNFTPLQP